MPPMSARACSGIASACGDINTPRLQNGLGFRLVGDLWGFDLDYGRQLGAAGECLVRARR